MMIEKNGTKKSITEKMGSMFKIVLTALVYAIVVLGALIFISYLARILSGLWR